MGEGGGVTAGYALDNRAPQAGARFGALSAVFDRWTFQHLEDIGVDTGWRCWEVGAGGPSVPRWLAGRVGATGEVLASDIDTSWLSGAEEFAVLDHDVAAHPAPAGVFDLVHARLVLTHVAHRSVALWHMAGALRPGGWLVIEDFDVSAQPLACPDAATDDEERANRVRAGFIELLAARDVDMHFGRTLRHRLRSLGLADVRAEAYAPLALPATRALELANIAQLRDGLAALGLGDDIDPHLAAVESGTVDIASPPLVTAWGQRAP
jgi:SAM-dependent methyltransferase